MGREDPMNFILFMIFFFINKFDWGDRKIIFNFILMMNFTLTKKYSRDNSVITMDSFILV